MPLVLPTLLAIAGFALKTWWQYHARWAKDEVDFKRRIADSLGGFAGILANVWAYGAPVLNIYLGLSSHSVMTKGDIGSLVLGACGLTFAITLDIVGKVQSRLGRAASTEFETLIDQFRKILAVVEEIQEVLPTAAQAQIRAKRQAKVGDNR